MKSIIKSLVVVVAVAAVASVATYAYFTDQAVVAGNTVAAGTLDLSVSPQTAAVNVSNAQPGVWKKSATVSAINDSTIGETTDSSNPENQIKWKVTTGTHSETDGGFFDKIYVSVWAQGLGYDQNPKTAPDGSAIEAQNVWNGYLKDLSYQFKNMPKGWSASVWVFSKLDDHTGNEYQGDSSTFNLVFDATQAVNPAWTE